MSARRKLYVNVAFGICGILIVWYCMLQLGRDIATRSLLASVHRSISRQLTGRARSQDWTVLSNEDLVKLVGASSTIDGVVVNGIPLDAWGRPVWVAIRMKSQDQTECIVCSNGPDGTPATKDDIITTGGYPDDNSGPAPNVN